MTDFSRLVARLKIILAKAPDGVIDASVKPMLEAWGDPPEAVQVLEVLDKVVHGGLASGMVVTSLNFLLKEAVEHEGTTYEAVVAQARFRCKTHV